MALREEMKRERAELEAKFPLKTGPEWLAVDPEVASWVVAFEARAHPSDVEISGCLRVHPGTVTLDWAQRTGMFIGKPRLEQGSKTVSREGLEEACAAAWARLQELPARCYDGTAVQLWLWRAGERAARMGACNLGDEGQEPTRILAQRALTALRDC